MNLNNEYDKNSKIWFTPLFSHFSINSNGGSKTNLYDKKRTFSQNVPIVKNHNSNTYGMNVSKFITYIRGLIFISCFSGEKAADYNKGIEKRFLYGKVVQLQNLFGWLFWKICIVYDLAYVFIYCCLNPNLFTSQNVVIIGISPIFCKTFVCPFSSDDCLVCCPATSSWVIFLSPLRTFSSFFLF